MLGASLIMAYSDRVNSVILLLMATLTWSAITSWSNCITATIIATIDFIITSLPAGLATLQDVAVQHFPSCLCLFQFGTFYAVPSQERLSAPVPPDYILLDETASPSRLSNPPPSEKPKRSPTVSIKNHPQKDLIVALAEVLFDSETKEYQDVKKDKDFLQQARRLVELSNSCIVITFRNPTPNEPFVSTAPTAVPPPIRSTVAPAQGKPTL